MRLDTDHPEVVNQLESVLVEVSSDIVPFFIERVKINPNGSVRMKFKDIDSEQQIEQIIKSNIYLPLSFLPELDEGQFLLP